MVSRNDLYDEERPLPYLVQLTRVDGAPLTTATANRHTILPALMHLDLRGGQFSRPASNRLAKSFDWWINSLKIRQRDADEYALMITPLPPRQDEEITGERIPYIPDDWPDLRQRSFLWVPVAYDETEERYAWQRQ